MGLFDILLKKTGELVQAKAEEILQKQIDMPIPTKTETFVREHTGEDCYSYPGTPEEYFSDLFARSFPEYEIERNVQVVTSGEENVPVSYMFVKNGKPVLAVILCYSQIYNRKRIVNTIRACEMKGIPAQRYFEDFRNEATYVCDRVRSALR